MTNQILFIQGAGEGAYKEDKLWAESLREKLGIDYDVRYPRMPEEDGATYEQWVPFEHMPLYAKKLPRATIRAFDDRGHQFNNDLSEVARDIKELMD